MSYNEFKKWLKAQGVEFQRGRGRHQWKISYNGKTTVLSDHTASEMKEGTRKAIIKQLGL